MCFSLMLKTALTFWIKLLIIKFLFNPPTLAVAHLRRRQDHANRTRLEETLKVERAVLQTGGDEAMRSRAQNGANG